MSLNLEQKPLRTWSHLAKQRKRPSEYDVVSKKLHYSTNNPDAPWEQSPDSPMNKWYKKYRNASPLTHDDWDDFSDPDRQVYRTYNMMQDGQEHHVFSLFDQFNEREHDKMLEKEWVEALNAIYSPLRYLFHATQMASTYVAQMAPASTITNCNVLQSADYLRLVSHTAYRTCELAKTYKDMGFGKNERQTWELSAQFQPMRELVEKQLCAYDWAEAFASLSLVVIPMISEGVLKPLSGTSHQFNDTLMPLLIDSQLKDVERQLRWAETLIEFSCADNEKNRETLKGWIEKWMPLAENAISAYIKSIPNCTVSSESAISAIKEFHAKLKLN